MGNKFIFDVDGTLTPSRGRINKQFALWFSKFCENKDVYLVTGSDRDKTVEQVGEYIYHKCKRVYNCSGSDVYDGDVNVRKNNWTLPKSAHSWLNKQLDACDFDIRTGLHFEHRPGMVNFSIVGRNATQDQRQAWIDYEACNGNRRRIADQFNQLFGDLQATVGGETGIDIAPRGADKSQILQDFDDQDRIVFYGDAIFEGGNDWPLATALANQNKNHMYHRVSGWQDTFNKLKELL